MRLSAALAARFNTLVPAAAKRADPAAFVPAVAQMDGFDRGYRSAIAAVLPAADAERVLGEMATFRAGVMTVRERTHAAVDAIYARGNASLGGFDPLDTFVPPPPRISHLDIVNAADLGDRGRAEVVALRDRANATIAPFVAPYAARIIDEKRRRNTGFAGAIHAVLTPLCAQAGMKPSEAIEILAALADGWY